MAGERFCVRNYGVTAGVEGVGAQGCEYMTGGMVLCLGKTGRNFAAGMSGGVAYVLDEAGDFVGKRLNREMVKIYPLVECDDDEILKIKDMISKHVGYTGSKRGEQIIRNWENFSNLFLKILPEDYERVLIALKKAERRGLKGDDAVQAAFEENVAAGH